MNILEEKIKKILDSLTKEELMELKRQLLLNKELYVSSNDSEVIASYLENFHYNESKKEKFLKNF